MPIGSYAAIPILAETLFRRRPRSVLDLGMGFGGGGVAVRQWLDLGVKPWKTFLVGVEAWSHYRNPVWDLYNAVYVQTIEQFLAANESKFDVVLLCDVLEHFDKKAGASLLLMAKQHVSHRGSLIVSTPAEFFEQGAVYGNEYERHRCVWTEAELAELGFAVTRHGSRDWACGECLFALWQNC